MINLKDKIIIVTGGNGLLGSEIILQLKKHGALVINLEININLKVIYIHTIKHGFQTILQ